MDIFSGGLSLFEAFGFWEGLASLIVLSLLSGILYYVKKIYPDLHREKLEHKRRLEELERDRNNEQKEAYDYLRKASDRQDTLLNSNVQALQSLNTSLTMLGQTFEKVSDKLSGHDQKSQDMMLQLNNIATTMPTKESLSRLHDRIDQIQETGADKDDIQTLMQTLSGMDQRLQAANSTLTEIRTHQLVH